MGLGSWFADRRALVELRGLRRAAERIADALELQVGHAPRSGQSFRGFSRSKDPSQDQSMVSYADPQEQLQIEHHTREFRAIMGRDPTEVELIRALEGRLED